MFDTFSNAWRNVFKRANWEGARSPYGLPVPICYGVTWVTPIQVYAGEQIFGYSGEAGIVAPLMVPVYTVDDATGALSIEEKAQTCQSAVLVLCEKATTILDILKDGVSINSGQLDEDPITTVTQRLRMISGRLKDTPDVIPPAGEEHGYFWPGLPGTAPVHTRFSRTANLGDAPYDYSSICRVDFCALGINASYVGQPQAVNLKFKMQGELAASSTVGADPVEVLLDLWDRAGMTADLDVETYYRDFCDDGGGSGTDQWLVNRAIESQTSAKELIDSLLFETFSTAVTLEDGTVQIIPRNGGDVSATALGVDDFLADEADPVSCVRTQASDAFNCVPVSYRVTTVSGTNDVTNEDTTFAVANPSSYGIAGIHRAPAVSASWVSTAEHALNLSYLLAQESFTVRRTFKFRLHPRWVMLQAGDTVSLTEPNLGLSSQVARIVSLSEDESGAISVEADEYFGAVAYTTPEVDPTDGFDGTLPGIPKDPTQGAVDAMLSDNILSPVEKPNFVSIMATVHKTIVDAEGATWWDVHTAIGVPPELYEDGLTDELAVIGFDAGWFDIAAMWPDSGDQATQRALLAAWMAETTVITDVHFSGYMENGINTATAMRTAQLEYLGSAAGLLEVLASPTGTSTFLRADGTWANPIHELTLFSAAAPGNAAIMGRWAIAHDLSFAANFSGSNVNAGTAATASTVLTVKKNGSSVGTLTFAISGTVPTMSCSAWTVAPDDIITIENQATADATLALISITLISSRTG